MFFCVDLMFCIVIVAEQSVPLYHRTLKPINVDGQAGGERFLHGQVLFKFAR